MYKTRGDPFNAAVLMPQPLVAAVAPRGERRTDILLAAERLFARHGYRGATIRQIAERAAVPLALVGYYFGPKHALFHAVFEPWRRTIDECLALLAQAGQGQSGGNRLRAIVRAFVAPVLQLRAGPVGEDHALLVARELACRTPEAEPVLAESFDPMARAFIDALHGACPGSTRPQAAWACQFALGALIHHLSDQRVQRPSLGECRSGDTAVAQMLVEFIVGGVEAALPPPKTHPRPAPPDPPTRRQT